MTVSVPRLLLAILVGSLAAGPIFICAGFIGELFVEGSVFGEGRGTMDAGGFILLLLVSMLFGSLLAVLPNAIGTFVLGLLGRHITLLRHPLLWGVTGGGFGFLIGMGANYGPDLGFTVLLAVTGALSAFVCRSFVRWRSAVEPADPSVFR